MRSIPNSLESSKRWIPTQPLIRSSSVLNDCDLQVGHSFSPCLIKSLQLEHRLCVPTTSLNLNTAGILPSPRLSKDRESSQTQCSNGSHGSPFTSIRTLSCSKIVA